jgi:hypothetical protein
MRAPFFAVAGLTLCILGCGSRENSQLRTGGIVPQFSRVDTAVTQEDSTSARFYEYDPGNLRDPFVKPGVKRRRASGEVDAGPPPLKVEIILYDNVNPLAMINGQSVRQGDTISGATIETIHTDRVIIRYHGKSYTLMLE